MKKGSNDKRGFKTKKSSIFFVIPAYNEGFMIKNVLKKLVSENYRNIIVVDDGSEDDTFENASEIKDVKVLKHPINRGQGAALRTGIEYCLESKKCKFIVTFDSDGQHRIEDLPKFIRNLEDNRADVVLGSRFLISRTKRLVPFKKRVVLKAGTLVTRIVSDIKLTDTHNGYRAMNRKAAERIDISLDGFEHASEILDEIKKKRLRYKEVPVSIDYTDYSKQKGQKISNAIKILLKIIFR
ncbi:MAG: glycosyltransferase family 2 protein [Nanobdellota archaeon]